MIAQMPDLVVTDKKRWPVMVVEVQNPKSFDRDYAIDFRKEIVPNLALAERVPYFMFVSQDRGYLWLNNDKLGLDEPPSLEFDMKPVVRHFTSRFKRKAKTRLPSELLEYYVSLWIDEMINPNANGRRPTVPRKLESIFNKLQGGSVQEEAFSL